MDRKFVYADETDRSYGLTGMAISMNVFDSSSMLHHITLDAPEGDDSIVFTPDFFFCSNPRYSAKIAWKEMVKQYQLLTGLVIGNVLCRYNVQRRQMLSRDMRLALRSLIAQEGREMCSFDEDEIDAMFNQSLSYLSNIFSNARIHRLANGFVQVLRTRRTLSGSEVMDELQNLDR